MNSAQIQRQLDGLWTAQDVCAEYGVTAMTVHLWRAKGMPAVVIPGQKRPAIRFVRQEVQSWARTQGIRPAHERVRKAPVAEAAGAAA